MTTSQKMASGSPLTERSDMPRGAPELATWVDHVNECPVCQYDGIRWCMDATVLDRMYINERMKESE